MFFVLCCFLLVKKKLCRARRFVSRMSMVNLAHLQLHIEDKFALETPVEYTEMCKMSPIIYDFQRDIVTSSVRMYSGMLYGEFFMPSATENVFEGSLYKYISIRAAGYYQQFGL